MSELHFTSQGPIRGTDECIEGYEPPYFAQIFGLKAEAKLNFCRIRLPVSKTMRMFNLSTMSGSFDATEIQSSNWTAEIPYCPFPFIQSLLYDTSQPGRSLVDTMCAFQKHLHAFVNKIFHKILG